MRRNYCTECGAFIFHLPDRQIGTHWACRVEEPLEALDLEDQLDQALGGDRKPYGRNGGDMDLPAGMTCADCAHCRRCTLMFGHIPGDESCDWAPSRFTPKRLEVQANG